MEIDELIKGLDEKLIVIKKEIIDNIMYIYCETKKQNTKCRYCGKKSESVHSCYTRTISDLPIQKYKVKLIIKVKKYFCFNEKCSHTTFAEPLDFVEKKGKTSLLNSRLKGLRQEIRTNTRYLKRSQIKKYYSKI